MPGKSAGPSKDPLITFRRVPEHAGFHRGELEAFAEELRRRVAEGKSFHCRITGDAELQRLNREFLGKDYATDVLSFPSAAPEPRREHGSELGDMAISRHRAAAQALRFGHTLTTELQLLMLHGLLHLLGMDHESDGGRMGRAERSWRAKLDLPAGVIERAHSRSALPARAAR
jgi:probable rRNA maturation factor